jgi:hypothetical protein
MAKQQPDYVSYLLRLWRASDGEGPAWRASLESPHTGERRGFASLDELFDFLQQEITVSSDASGDEGETGK